MTIMDGKYSQFTVIAFPVIRNRRRLLPAAVCNGRMRMDEPDFEVGLEGKQREGKSLVSVRIVRVVRRHLAITSRKFGLPLLVFSNLENGLWLGGASGPSAIGRAAEEFTAAEAKKGRPCACPSDRSE